MVFDDESLGCRRLLIERTAGQLKDPVAVVAVKVVMMPLACALEERTRDRVVDLFEPAFVDQQLKIAIDRGPVKGSRQNAAEPKDLVDPQGAVFIEKDLFNGVSLGCFSLHARGSGHQYSRRPLSMQKVSQYRLTASTHSL